VIKASPTPPEAREALTSRHWSPGAVTEMLARAGNVSTRPDNATAEFGPGPQGYKLSIPQAQAILDLRLQRLTGLEQGKIITEYQELLVRIREFSEILADPDRLIAVIRAELSEIRDNYADARRTEIVQAHSSLEIEDLIPEEDVVVTLSHGGYAKAQSVSDYQVQRRGGKGRAAAKVKDEDFIDKLFVANTHDTLLCFTSTGKVYWLKVYEVPRAGPGARGRPMVNLLPLEPEERINAVLPVRQFTDHNYIFMATSDGTVKKTSLDAFSRPRTAGIRAIELHEGDQLVDVAITDGECDIMLCVSSGKAIRFQESDVRPMGRTAAGVRGIRVAEGHEVIALLIIGEGEVLTATEKGYGKRTAVSEFPVQCRGGQGVIAIQTSDRNGRMVGAIQVRDEDEIVLISSSGTLVRTPVGDVSQQGRNTQGVRLIRIDDEDRLVGLDRILPEADETGEAGEVTS
jgi:DNA gyrase subunit A